MHIYLFYQKWLLNFTFEYSLTDVFHWECALILKDFQEMA